MNNQKIKSFKFTDPKSFKVGDVVFLGDLNECKLDFCTACKPPTDEWIEQHIGQLIFDKPCDFHRHE